jgi:hypothetical protein
MEAVMDLGRVNSFEASCVVQDDPGEVVRGARRVTADDVVRMREQMIARLVAQSRPLKTVPDWPSAVSERVRLAMKDWRPGY